MPTQLPVCIAKGRTRVIASAKTVQRSHRATMDWGLLFDSTQLCGQVKSRFAIVLQSLFVDGLCVGTDTLDTFYSGLCFSMGAVYTWVLFLFEYYDPMLGRRERLHANVKSVLDGVW